MVSQPDVLATECTKLRKDEIFLVANACRVEIVIYLYLVTVPSTHDTVDAPVKLLEVSNSLHLKPNHQVLVLYICPILTIFICLFIPLEFMVCVDAMSYSRVIYSNIKIFPLRVRYPSEAVVERVLSYTSTWVGQVIWVCNFLFVPLNPLLFEPIIIKHFSIGCITFAPCRIIWSFKVNSS